MISLYLSAFMVGLLGGVHCVGMCGGIVGALSAGAAPDRLGRPGRMLPLHIGYNLGRLASYTLAGLIFGGIGSVSAGLLPVRSAQTLLLGLAGLFMMALGLYLGGWWRGLARLEEMGAVVWRGLQPVAAKLMPVRSVPMALSAGALWGWLPCGLVYSVLAVALTAGGPVSGGLLMLSFGLGTLPALLASGVAASALTGFLRRSWVRQAVGVMIFLFGVVNLFGALGVLPYRDPMFGGSPHGAEMVVAPAPRSR